MTYLTWKKRRTKDFGAEIFRLYVFYVFVHRWRSIRIAWNIKSRCPNSSPMKIPMWILGFISLKLGGFSMGEMLVLGRVAVGVGGWGEARRIKYNLVGSMVCKLFFLSKHIQPYPTIQPWTTWIFLRLDLLNKLWCIWYTKPTQPD